MPKVGKRISMSGAEVLLINPSLMKPPVTPVAVDFLASTLRAGGFAVRFLDFAIEREIDYDDDSALSEAIHCCERVVSWDILCHLKNKEALV